MDANAGYAPRGMGGMKTIVNELRDELRVAHIIIRSALSVATFDQEIGRAHV